jgi:two-component system chemotaxis response regulator CheY
MKILIADDSRVMRQIIVRTLRQAGFGDHEVIEAADGELALKATVDEEPDLILSDWNMPNLSGIDLLRELRGMGIMTPLGFVTTEGTPEMHAMAAEAGALFLMTKPFTEDTFRDKLGPILG